MIILLAILIVGYFGLNLLAGVGAAILVYGRANKVFKWEKENNKAKRDRMERCRQANR